MKRILFALLFVPCALAAKPKLPPEQMWLDKNVERAGGPAKFERLQTFSCQFEETVKLSSGTVLQRGRWAFRRDGAGGLKFREDLEGGAATVVLSTAAADERGRRMMREIFWTFAPQWIRAETRPLRLLANGFLSHRLLERVAVDGVPLFPDGENLILFITAEDGLIVGASAGAVAQSVSFHTFETTPGFLTLPTVRVYYNDAGKQIRMVKISNITVNGYLEEKLFAPGATP